MRASEAWRRLFALGSAASALLALLTAPSLAQTEAETQPERALQTETVLLVTIDGVRWQEVFRGADQALLDEEVGGVDDLDGLRERFWREEPEERRQALMPFFWSTVVGRGVVWGDRDAGSEVTFANGKNFSYPGYSELLVGAPDDRIDSNAKRTNPNRTVLEWLRAQPGLEDRVSVVGSWDVFPWIVAAERSELWVNAGWQAYDPDSTAPQVRMLDLLQANTTREWEGVRFDAFTLEVARERLREARPRVLYLALGEPDDWAHQRRYDRYLESLHRADRFLEELWSASRIGSRAGRLTLVVTTDHGRGSAGDDWTSHGAEVEGSGAGWIAVLGPDTPWRGVLGEGADATPGQVAATVAALLGLDWTAVEPRAAPPLADALPAPAGESRP